MIVFFFFSFGMGIEFREGLLFIILKNNYVVKKGEIVNRLRNLCFSLVNLIK